VILRQEVAEFESRSVGVKANATCHETAINWLTPNIAPLLTCRSFFLPFEKLTGRLTPPLAI
jgi:hypothetical protein